MKQLFRLFCLLAVGALLAGCEGFVLFDSKGEVGIQQRNIIIIQVLLMLLVVLPAIGMSLWYGFKYRKNRPQADQDYSPEWDHSSKIEKWVWGVPCVIIAVMAVVSYMATHKLDPYRPLEHEKQAVKIQAIAAPFQWVFVYPEHNIATVNEIYFPENIPINFTITSDFTMNSFFIPQLGGQIYAMAGMKTQLNLIANEQGVFDGISANYAGHGFSRMKFKAHAVSQARYEQWIAQVKTSTDTLDFKTFKSIQAPVHQTSMVHHESGPRKAQQPDPVRYFGTVSTGLLQEIVDQYMQNFHPDLMTCRPGQPLPGDEAVSLGGN